MPLSYALLGGAYSFDLPSPSPSSFSLQNIKKKFPLVLSRVNQLVDRITAQGATASIDVDQAALRVTLDVIGLVSWLGSKGLRGHSL